MKALHRNIRILSLMLAGMFVLLAGYLSYTYYSYGSRWFSNSSNPRLQSEKSRVIAGTIYDRSSIPLAWTNKNGEREYISSKTTRLSVAHVLGDDGGIVPSGVQNFHAGYLLGFNTNLLDNIMTTLQGQQRKGDNITLTIDSKLSRYIREKFPSGMRGAVAVINYSTGEIYALVSLPAFDPENIAEAMATEDQTAAPLINRATQSAYTPGSIFKIITAAGALDSWQDAQQRIFNCSGTYLAGRFTIVDSNSAVHGDISLQEAFSKSCNITFSQIGVQLGVKKLQTIAENFRFNDEFLFKDIMLYRSQFQTDQSDIGNVAWAAVGQDKTTVTPLHMAMVAGAVANGGTMMEPTLLKNVVSAQGQLRLLLPARGYARISGEATAAVLKSYMITAVESGTATGAKIRGYDVGGKTGTAEVSDDGSAKPHAWFVGFVDDTQHPLAIAVIVENAGYGSEHAVPLANKVLKKAIELGL